MDPITLASTIVGLISPLIMKGVEEVTKSSFKDIYAAIKEKLSGDPESKHAIQEFEKSPEQAKPVFQAALQKHIEADKAFYELLLRVVQNHQSAAQGGINIKKINAKKVVVAEKIDKLDMGN